MHRANVPLKHRYKLFKEAFTTITQLDWLAVIEIDGVYKTRYRHWKDSDNDPKFAKYLRTWGEAGTVKDKKGHNIQIGRQRHHLYVSRICSQS